MGDRTTIGGEMRIKDMSEATLTLEGVASVLGLCVDEDRDLDRGMCQVLRAAVLDVMAHIDPDMEG